MARRHSSGKATTRRYRRRRCFLTSLRAHRLYRTWIHACQRGKGWLLTTQFTGAVLDFALEERRDQLDKRNTGRGKTRSELARRGVRFHAGVGQVARRVIKQSIEAINISVKKSTDKKDGPIRLRKAALSTLKKNWKRSWESLAWLMGRKS